MDPEERPGAPDCERVKIGGKGREGERKREGRREGEGKRWQMGCMGGEGQGKRG